MKIILIHFFNALIIKSLIIFFFFVITNFVTNGPTDEEIKSAKENLTNGFPLRIDSNKKILDNVASIAWNELPLDTLNTWTMQLNAVTKDQVIAAYKKHLDMNKMVTVVVGGQ